MKEFPIISLLILMNFTVKNETDEVFAAAAAAVWLYQ
jgi:hypothetical protein